MKNLEFLKPFDRYFVNEAANKSGHKVIWVSLSTTLDEIKTLSKEAYDYAMEVTNILKTDPEYVKAPVIKMNFIKKANVGLSEEAANKLVESFKQDKELKFGADQFNTVFIDKKSFKEILDENVKLKNLYTEATNAITEWNKNNASVFQFDHDVSDKVSNPDDSNKALSALKDILVKYAIIVKNVTLDLTGYTSTLGDPKLNQTVSEGRAATIKNMLLAIWPEAKDMAINTYGKGEENPIFPDDKDDKEKQAKNRRVEAKLDASTGAIPKETEVTKFNIIIYGFTLIEEDEHKTPTNFAPRKKGGFKPLDKKGHIPCPSFMHKKR